MPSAEYVFRAGSVLPDDRVAALDKRLVVIRNAGEYFAFEPAVLSDTFGPAAIVADAARTTWHAADLRVLRAAAKGAQAEMARTIGSYNIVEYDGCFYGIPQRMGHIDWASVDLSGPEFLRAHTMKAIAAQVEAALGIDPATKVDRGKPAAQRPRTIPLAPAAPAARIAPRLVASLDR